MQNRRNYYRILRVQPDASVEVIKESYRALMQKLRMHPDLGGEDWNASVANQAYATLRNPTKRAAYDLALLREHNIATLSQGHLKIPRPKSRQTKKSVFSSKNNRRNYYRILHVQPDAESVVIAASYHALKKQSNGSDDLIDKAWGVLGNEQKRTIYDKALQQDPSKGKPKPKFVDKHQPAATIGSVAKKRMAVKKSQLVNIYGKKQAGMYEAVITSYCLFCKTPYVRSQHIEDAQRCNVCASPLLSPPSALLDQPRRWLERMQQNTSMTFYEYWPGESYSGSLLDLSPTGLRFSSMNKMDLDQVIKIDGYGFAAVAVVTSCQQVASTMQTGVRFSAVSFDRQSGSFFSTSV